MPSNSGYLNVDSAEVDHEAGNFAELSASGESSPIDQQGHSAADAYEPAQGEESSDRVSGTVFILLMLCGLLGVVVGYAVGGCCVGAAVLINVFHNLLPKFYFVMPIIILAVLVMAPLAYGVGVGSVVGQTASLMRHRHPESAGVIALFWAIVGLAIFPWVMEAPLPNGEEFFDDVLMPFVELMVGGCINFEWLEEPKPVDVAPWIVYTVLGVTGLMGVVCAYGKADDEVRDEPEAEVPDEPDSDEDAEY